MALQNVMYGRPRRREAEQLRNRLLETRPGDVVHHKEMLEILGFADREGRYRSLVSLARKMVHEETGVWMETVFDVGLRHPTGIQQITNASQGMRRAIKHIRRSGHHAETVDDSRLDEVGRRCRDHMVMRTNYLAQVAKAETKSIQVHLPKPEPQPQRRLPENGEGKDEGEQA